MNYLSLLKRLVERGYENGMLLNAVASMRRGEHALDFSTHEVLIRNGLELDRKAVFMAAFPERAGEETPFPDSWKARMEQAHNMFLGGEIPREIDYLLHEGYWLENLPKQP